MTERRILIELTPTQPAVFSQRAASEGAHASRTAPTGAALLGWAAAHCYPDDAAMAHRVFHSGMVRFSDAVRMTDQGPAFPNPAILFEPKHGIGKPALGRAKFFAHTENDGKLPEGVKGRMVTLKGHDALEPVMHHRLRTAMKDGVADTGKLFGYQSVQPGSTRMRATIECAAGTDIDDDMWASITNAFRNSTLRLGKARGSGYGGAYHSVVVEDDTDLWSKPHSTSSARLQFWLLSDAQFIDSFGCPATEVGPEDFGLDTELWRLDPSETSVSTRRIWPWNGKYRGRDMECSLVNAGSVFTFSTRSGQPEHASPKLLIGTGHERGYGRAALLEDGEFEFNSNLGRDKRKPPNADATSDLVKWAQAKRTVQIGFSNVQWSDGLIAEFSKSVRALEGEGPGTTQWSRLFELKAEFLASSPSFGVSMEEILAGPGWDIGFPSAAFLVRSRLFGDLSGVTPRPSWADIERVIVASRSAVRGGN